MAANIEGYSERLIHSQIKAHESLLKSCKESEKPNIEAHLNALKAELARRHSK